MTWSTSDNHQLVLSTFLHDRAYGTQRAVQTSGLQSTSHRQTHRSGFPPTQSPKMPHRRYPLPYPKQVSAEDLDKAETTVYVEYIQ